LAAFEVITEALDLGTGVTDAPHHSFSFQQSGPVWF
jgi:hypothetical protein